MNKASKPPSASPSLVPDARHPDKPQESLRDTIESVVVAFVLAFVFRAFVVEAFVIPTGSMAATLYGEHWTHDCSNCGYEFAVGADRQRNGKLAPPPARLTCPNCNVEDEARLSSGRIDSGDRILVLKWPLDLCGIFPSLAPKRWDVTVFKDPKDGETNFIKRLVGLPNEVLMILDGDVYVAAAGDLPAELLARIETIRELNYQLGRTQDEREARWLRGQIAELRPVVTRDLLPYLRIQRKPEKAQEALWSIVYDHDHPARRHQGGVVGRPGWAPVVSPSGWSVSRGVLAFDGLEQPADTIMFAGKRLVDHYAYNAGFRAAEARPMEVTDHRLRFVLIPEQGDGLLRVVLRKLEDTFAATFRADGTVLLSMFRDDDPTDRAKPLAQASIGAFRHQQPIEIEMRNVDYRVSVRVNGREVLATTDENYAPPGLALVDGANRGPRWNPETAEIAMVAERLRFKVIHIVLERDVYYRSSSIEPGSRDDQNNPWAHQPGWGTEGNPIHLRGNDYFMLGDNSPASEDGRLWRIVGDHLASRGADYQMGTVPQDQLIGKAFFVYWPSGYRPSFLRWGIIPNVGRMRWIH